MEKKNKIEKIKCKHCQTILTSEIQLFQTCECGKLSYDTDNLSFLRIVGDLDACEII